MKDAVLPSVQCHARTTIAVNRTTYSWKIKNFEELDNNAGGQKSSCMLTERASFVIELSSVIGKFEEDKIEITITPTETIEQLFMSTCKVSVLGVNETIVHTVKDEFWFQTNKKVQFWKFPIISRDKILRDKELYLPDGALSLRFEFAVSFGVRYDEVVRIERGSADQIEYFKVQKKEIKFPGSLQQNLQRFYEEGKLSDFLIQTPNKEFLVHKTILSARSEVFSVMFEGDMKESQNGVLKIEDIDDVTVSKMLLFLYTDNVGEDLDWEIASSLYFAADKYAILALKRKSSDFMKDNFAVANICEVLVLADMHRDQELKSAAQNFIYEHYEEIIDSEEWKKFMEEKLPLAAIVEKALNFLLIFLFIPLKKIFEILFLNYRYSLNKYM